MWRRNLVMVPAGQPFLESIERSLGAAGQVKLAQDVADVRPDRGLADDETVGNILVFESLGEQPQHFDFAMGQGVLSETALGASLQFLQDLPRDEGMKRGLTAIDLADGVDQGV